MKSTKNILITLMSISLGGWLSAALAGMRQGRRWGRGRRVAVLGLALWLASLGSGQAQQLEWARKDGGGNLETASGIAISGSGHSSVTGSFSGSGTTTFGPTTFMMSDEINMFVAHYNGSGALEWVKEVRGNRPTSQDSIFGQAVAVDASGNTYVTGNFSGKVLFGAGQQNPIELSSSPHFQTGPTFDIFVAKYDHNGQCLWATQAGSGQGFDGAFGIGVDASGNTYVTGRFFFKATFGDGETNETELMAAGGNVDDDIFVAKYNPNGQLVWVKRAGGILGEQGLAIAVDGSGHSYVTGFFEGTSNFGEGANQTTLFGSGLRRDTFVAKYAPDGQFMWAKQAGGSGSAENWGWAIAVDANGHSYVTGFIAGFTTFGEGETNETDLTPAGAVDIFVARYDGNGQLVWATQAGGTSVAEGLGIAVDSGGDLHVTGRFRDTATFGRGEANETVLTSAGSNDIFVARYNSSGQLLGAKRAGGTGGDGGDGIAADNSGNSYVTGSFVGTATFGPGEANQTVLTSAGSTDIFVAKFGSVDTDNDGVADEEDNCPLTLNPNQANADNDALGDACDACTDTDNDGFGNPGFMTNTCALDNCPTASNPDQANADGDSLGNACDPDDDGDGVADGVDNCPLKTNADQKDGDEDGIGNVCDTVANCLGQVATIVGTEGDDIIAVPLGNHVIHGLGGNDVIVGVVGNEVICGGPGNDTLSGVLGNDKLDGGSGSDLCNGGLGTDTAVNCETKLLVP